MPSGLYDADGKIRLTQSPGSGFCGRYAPDGSTYFTTAPGSGFCGSTAPDGSMYIVDATGSTTIGAYAPNGAIRVTTGNEYNGAWRVSGVSSVVASWDASTSTLALLADITTHTRASLATMFDSTGKLTYAPNNLLLQSNTFSNAAWNQNATVSIAGGVSDPVGGSAASTVTATANNAVLGQGVVVGASLPGFTVGIWARRRTGSGAVYLYGPDSNAPGRYAMALSSSWQFFPNSGASNGDTKAYLVLLFATSGDAIDVYAGVLSRVTYETTPRTADQVITTSSAYYGPRIDYDPNTLAVKGLLIEETRTNLQPNSGALNGANWSVSNVTKSATVTGPDGVAASAQTFTASAGSAAHFAVYTTNATIVSGSTYSYTVFAKAGTSNFAVVNLYGNAAGNWASAVFDLSNVSNSAASQTAQGATSGTVASTGQQYLGNGWFRLRVTGSVNTTQFDAIFGFAGAATGNTFDTFGCVTFAAAGTETLSFYGPQIELGSFATSYIPTAASSVTRAADVVQFTGAALTALQGSAGSAIVEMTDAAVGYGAGGGVLIGGTSNYWLNLAVGAIYSQASSINLNTANTTAAGSPFRGGVAWGPSARSIALNGGTVAKDTTSGWSGQTPYLGSYGGASNWTNGHAKSFAIYNQRLADGTLQSRSVVGASY